MYAAATPSPGGRLLIQRLTERIQGTTGWTREGGKASTAALDAGRAADRPEDPLTLSYGWILSLSGKSFPAPLPQSLLSEAAGGLFR